MDASGLYYEMLESEKVTVTAGGADDLDRLDAMRAAGGNLPLSTLKRILVGGSAMPPSLIAKFDQEFGIEVRHAWGMTETVAIATMCTLNSQQAAMPCAERHAITAKPRKVSLRCRDQGRR